MRAFSATWIAAPALVIHSRFDGNVDRSHPELACRHIPQAEFVETMAESHLIWFSPHHAGVQESMRRFLDRLEPHPKPQKEVEPR